MSAARMLFTIYIAIHTTSANRTFDNSGQNMLVIQTVSFDVGNTGFLSLFVHLIPQFFWHNCLMDTVVKHILVLLYNMIFISCTRNFLILSSAKSKLATVHRIIQNTFYKRCRKAFYGIVLTKLFLVSAVVQECSNSCNPHSGIGKFIVNNTDNLGLVFCYVQFTID